MDLVKEFKDKLAKMAKLTGWKYKILYKGYEEALKEKRLHVYFHKPCKLAEITTPEGVVTLEIAGQLDADLMMGDDYVLSLSDCIDPLTPFDTAVVDDVGISHDGVSISTDQDIVKYSNPESEWHFNFKSETFIQAQFGDKTYMFTDPSIAKAVFDVDAIKELIGAEAAPEEKPKKKKKEEPKEEPEPPKEKATEEAPKKEAPKESKKETPKKETKKEPPEEEEKPKKAKIKDSGNRTEFASGAVRDIQEGKGRCDLLPLDIVGEFFECTPDKSGFEEIALFQEDHDRAHLIKAAKSLSSEIFPNDETAILEYACHLEDGCAKYGDRNWEKGIPLSRFIDSGIRHYLKFRRGDDDERHDRAFIWNMLCGAWTCKHHPDLIEQ